MIQNNFKLISPGWNCSSYVSDCITSVLNQSYQNWEQIVINDNSTDDTEEKVLSFSHEKRLFYKRNQENLYAIENCVDGINLLCSDPEDVIVFLDADDYLIDSNVLKKLNEAYQDENLWLTYGQYVTKSTGKIGCCHPITESRNIRHQSWCLSHLKTMKYKLWKQIKDEDLRDWDGNYIRFGWDQFMLFAVELAGIKRIKCFSEPLMMYVDSNPLSDCKDSTKQKYIDTLLPFIRNKEPYTECS